MSGAARLGDEVKHSSGLAGFLVGAVAGAVAAVAIVTATAATGGVALALIVGASACGAGAAGEIITECCDLPGITTGSLIPLTTSNVIINNRIAAKIQDPVVPCWFPILFPHGPVSIVEGSSTVYINKYPATRMGDELNCGAFVASGSPNVIIGGAKYRIPGTEQSWLSYALTRVGLAITATSIALNPAAGIGSLVAVGVVQKDYKTHSNLSNEVADMLNISPEWGGFVLETFVSVLGGKISGIGSQSAIASQASKQVGIIAERAKSAAWGRYKKLLDYKAWSKKYDTLMENRRIPNPTKIQNEISTMLKKSKLLDEIFLEIPGPATQATQIITKPDEGEQI